LFSQAKCKSWHQVIDKVHKIGEATTIGIPISAYTEYKESTEDEEIISTDIIEVKVLGIEEAIIQRVIRDKGMQSELRSIARELKEFREVDIYTDGSMVVENEGGSEIKKMGIGWTIVDENNSVSNISFKSRIVDWPSSTRAELGAIWTALLVVPYEAKVRIYTDSKAAIEGIQKFKSINNIRNNFKIRNRSLISQIDECCKAKRIKLELIKVRGHSMNKWNDRADKLAKEGLASNWTLEVQDVTTSKIGVVPMWRDKIIDNPLRTFVNITTATVYETAWADLNCMKTVLNQRSSHHSDDRLDWRNTWNTIKKLQGRKCTSIKKSKALMFRIKCLNKLLPTKDICFQRDPALYKSKTCIACYAKEESFEHLADCQMYQKIWKHIEEFIIGELESKISEKWKIAATGQKLKEVFLGSNIEDNLSRRKLYIRGLTSKCLIAKVKSLLGSGSKAGKAICWFTEIFWSNFFERLWKFRCEIMLEWEKRNEIDLKKKRKNTRRSLKTKSNLRSKGKEKQNPEIRKDRESEKEKGKRIQEVAETKVSRWIKEGIKENWLSFKNI
jgi:ribonuclease HI